ncbi:MAG: type VII toxin-antitoxin system HepT family RNase toxin [Salinispira sp.]
MNETLIQKIQSVQHCLKRAREVYRACKENFAENYDAQDIAVLNLIRLCETTIDIANFLIRRNKLGIPASGAESFELLGQAGLIEPKVVAGLRAMVAFRNIAVHQYKKLDINIVIRVIEHDSNDVVAFLDHIIGEES